MAGYWARAEAEPHVAAGRRARVRADAAVVWGRAPVARARAIIRWNTDNPQKKKKKEVEHRPEERHHISFVSVLAARARLAVVSGDKTSQRFPDRIMGTASCLPRTPLHIDPLPSRCFCITYVWPPSVVRRQPVLIKVTTSNCTKAPLHAGGMIQQFTKHMY